MRIVVFGAGGFVGGWVCEVLSQRSDIELVACVRRWASAVRLARRGIDIRRADLEDGSVLPAILDGADVVVNATMPAPAREPELVTALYSASANAGVRRFIQFSSAAVYGSASGDVDEQITPAPLEEYGRGKAEMERRLIEGAVPPAPQLFILRPSIVYGPFADFWTVRYVERVAQGRWRGLGRIGEGTCNLVHGYDVARAVVAAATANIAPGTHVLNINGPYVVTWNEYIERLGDALGIAGRHTPAATVFRAMTVFAEILRRGGKIASVRSLYRRSAGTTRAAMARGLAVTKLYPQASELALLRRKVHYKGNLASEVLGWTPSVTLETGIHQSVAWCRAHGIV